MRGRVWGECRLSQAGLEEGWGCLRLVQNEETLYSDVMLFGGGAWDIMGRRPPTPRLLEAPGLQPMRKPQGGHLLISASLPALCLAQMACTQQGESPPNLCLPKVDLNGSGVDPGGLGALAYTPTC